jgi:peptide-methionine (R)-S-oxide reductase
MSKIQKTAAEWQAELTPQEFQVCREKGTERAFTGEYWNCHEEGVYHCKCCGAPLFSSETKFESGSGWPSFYQSLQTDAIAENRDISHGRCVPKLFVSNVMRIWGMFFLMVLIQRVCVTV